MHNPITSMTIVRQVHPIKLSTRILINIFLISLLVVLQGCSGGFAILATHEPLHPVRKDRVTFKASLAGPIKKVVLSYTRFALSLAPDGSLIRNEVETDKVTKVCEPTPGVYDSNCIHTMPNHFPDSSLITYTAQAYGIDGSKVKDEYSFAIGNYPIPNAPIPIRVKGKTISSFDIVFLPDTDVPVNSFLPKLTELIERRYFRYDTFRVWRGFYNFYYTPTTGHYDNATQGFSVPNYGSLRKWVDAIVILHQANLRDASGGIIFSTEIDGEKSLVHETGHTLFGLEDEYCCDSVYDAQKSYANIWNSLLECQAAAINLGENPASCQKIVGIAASDRTKNGYGAVVDVWRVDPDSAGGCVMGEHQHESDSDFGKACLNRIRWRYRQCTDGSCNPSVVQTSP